jgi:hypothetical protein
MCGTCDDDSSNDCEQDCAGTWGGSLVDDECGICGGDGSDNLGCGCFEPEPSGCDNECGSTAVIDGCGVCGGLNDSCDAPDMFVFSQSSEQSFYYFGSVTMNGVAIESDDWVGAFNGDVCVGARQWDTSLCSGGICDLPLMGEDNYEWTAGYMNSGDIPSFKIFDTSANLYYDAVVYTNASEYGYNGISDGFIRNTIITVF